MRLVAVTMAAAVHGDDRTARTAQRVIPARVFPVDKTAGNNAVDEQYGITLAHAVIGDAHTITGRDKISHGRTFAKPRSAVYDAAHAALDFYRRPERVYCRRRRRLCGARSAGT